MTGARRDSRNSNHSDLESQHPCCARLPIMTNLLIDTMVRPGDEAAMRETSMYQTQHVFSRRSK